MNSHKTLILLIISFLSLNAQNNSSKIIVGAERPELYFNLIKGKKIGIVTNQTGAINFSKEFKYPEGFPNKNLNYSEKENIHLVDFLIASKMNIVKIFAPEHGFRGVENAGEHVKDGIDQKTNLPIISLYGKNKKPSKELINDLDVIIFDIQDVGTRFYTYISTLHYVMEAAAENNKKVIVLDRPNPNAHYIDGPILDPKFTSFVGMHKVPIVYAMTIGEYAKMINGEKWLEKGIQTDLTIIPLKNYNHKSKYSLNISPSPNLPNDKSINIYASTCFFEGTTLSEGRGTDKPFQVYGSPDQNKTNFSFTPEPNKGDKNPKQKGLLCYGKDLSNEPFMSKISLKYIIDAYKNHKNKDDFFIKTGFFNKLAGNDILKTQIEQGLTEKQIKKTWKKDIEDFKIVRQKYLIYK